jgi:hypothetical protein
MLDRPGRKCYGSGGGCFTIMNITDELERLSKLRKDGTLNEEEFAAAKGRLLGQERDPAPRANPSGQSTDQFGASELLIVVAVILFLVFLLAVILPHAHFYHHFFHP